MLIEQALQSKLAGTSAISALVGDRIYYVRAPQDVTKPYICIQKISQVTQNVTSDSQRIVNARFQISIFDTTYASIKAIGAAIYTALDKYDGYMGGESGAWINNCTYDNEVDLGFDNDNLLYGLGVDYILDYSLDITN